MNVGLTLVKIAAIYMLIGVVMGVAMGISGNFSLSSTHSHILLLGWLTMSVSGIVYILIPGCNHNRLAMLHFWGHNVGLPVMTASLALYVYGYTDAEKTIGVGSVLILISLLVFTINLYRNGRLERPA